MGEIARPMSMPVRTTILEGKTCRRDYYVSDVHKGLVMRFLLDETEDRFLRLTNDFHYGGGLAGTEQ